MADLIGRVELFAGLSAEECAALPVRLSEALERRNAARRSALDAQPGAEGAAGGAEAPSLLGRIRSLFGLGA